MLLLLQAHSINNEQIIQTKQGGLEITQPRGYATKLFVVVINPAVLQATVFVAASCFHPILRFVGESKSLPIERFLATGYSQVCSTAAQKY
jgi:hypothetical protein